MIHAFIEGFLIRRCEPSAVVCAPRVREPRARRIGAGASIARGGVIRIEAGDGCWWRRVDPPLVA